VNEKEIIKRLKELGLEMSKQDGRSTDNPLWCDRSRDKYGTLQVSHNFSFFESDVEHSKDNYVLCNREATKMTELRKLLVELSGEDPYYF